MQKKDDKMERKIKYFAGIHKIKVLMNDTFPISG
jgi:hypothetical protein